MKKAIKTISIIALCIVVSLGTVTTAYALTGKATKEPNEVKKTEIKNNDKVEEKEVTKDETVYVIAGAEGEIKKIIVSDWIKNAINEESINDFSELENIKNVKGDETFVLNSDNSTVWDAEGNDIYYSGNVEKELPVDIKISYSLDGQNVDPKEIVGKSGRITIRFDYTNNQYEMVSIDGKEEKIYVPFAMLTGMLLDGENFKNVDVSNGRLVSDGDRTAVIGVAFPGLSSNLNIDSDDFEIPDYVEISADVDHFEMGMTVTIATNELFNNIDRDDLDSFDELSDDVEKLSDGMDALLDGSSKLYDGLDTLLEKSGELVDGINKLADGAGKLNDGAKKVNVGAKELSKGATTLSEGLDTIASNNKDLTNGAKQVFDTLLDTATTQLKSSGIETKKLTINNYAEVLDGIIKSLDKNAVYDKALAQVTAKVEENRPVIEQMVTAAVKEQVQQAIEQQIGNALTGEAKAQAVQQALAQKMQSDEVKAMISQNVELKIQQLISENMSSDEVQGQLEKASKGAKSLIELKSSLDSYNAFYLGIIAYTDGVSEAAAGAKKLSNGAKELSNGTESLKNGASELYEGILTLKNGAPALIDGVSELRDGSMKLSDGLQKLNDEGISKIVDYVENDAEDLVTRVRATIDVSKDYKNFAGINKEMNGKVKFIYRTEEVKEEIAE